MPKQITHSLTDADSWNKVDKSKYRLIGYEYQGEMYDDEESACYVVEEEIAENYNNIDVTTTSEYEYACENIDVVWEEMDVAEQIVYGYIDNKKVEKNTINMNNFYKITPNGKGEVK